MENDCKLNEISKPLLLTVSLCDDATSFSDGNRNKRSIAPAL